MHRNLKREKFKEAILDASRKIENDIEEWTWLESKEIDALLDAFYDLSRYYANNGDTEIGIWAFAIYLQWTRYFQTIVDDPFEPSTLEEIPEDAKRNAKKWLDRFEVCMDGIIKEATSNYHAYRARE